VPFHANYALYAIPYMEGVTPLDASAKNKYDHF